VNCSPGPLLQLASVIPVDSEVVVPETLTFQVAVWLMSEGCGRAGTTAKAWKQVESPVFMVCEEGVIVMLVTLAKVTVTEVEPLTIA
jgi:hypothetical protein